MRPECCPDHTSICSLHRHPQSSHQDDTHRQLGQKETLKAEANGTVERGDDKWGTTRGKQTVKNVRGAAKRWHTNSETWSWQTGRRQRCFDFCLVGLFLGQMHKHASGTVNKVNLTWDQQPQKWPNVQGQQKETLQIPYQMLFHFAFTYTKSKGNFRNFTSALCGLHQEIKYSIVCSLGLWSLFAVSVFNFFFFAAQQLRTWRPSNGQFPAAEHFPSQKHCHFPWAVCGQQTTVL